MRTLRNLAWFGIGVLIAFVLLVPHAYAQALPAPSIPAAVEAIHLANGTTSTVANASGVAANAPVNMRVVTPSGSVNVGLNVAAQVERAAIAKAAARAFAKAIPGVAAVATIAEVFDALRDRGYRPNPNTGEAEAMEQPGVPGDAAGTGYRVQVSTLPTDKTPGGACDMVGSSDQFWTYKGQLSGMNCLVMAVRKSDGFTYQQASYPIVKVANWYVPKYILATEVQTEQDVLDRMVQQHEMQKRLYDALKGDQKNFPGPWPDLYNPTSPLTPASVSASPASSQQRVTSTETITNPDGSTRTRTSTEQSTVSPVTSGGTLGDIKTTFPTTTTKTVTDRDNATGQVTTGTTVVNNPTPEEQTPTTPSENVDPCTGNPNRAGCALLGDPPEAPAIPQLDIPVTFTPVVFASSAGCPAPISYELYGARSLSYEPLCDVAGYVRAVFLACGAFVCAFIFMEGFKA
ncbi:hypothetical protein D3C72_66560 [compost metagenome]